MTTDTITVKLGPRSYEIAITTGQLTTVAAHAAIWLDRRFGLDKPGRRKVLVVADENVVAPHANQVVSGFDNDDWQTTLSMLKSGEETKCLAVMSSLYDDLVEIPADRRTLIVAVGGGVTGDTAGFAAASYARGIPFLQVPTTLLAQVDSSVGGKTGINHPKGKNLIGAFHQPVGVFIDTQTLSTLPEREYRSGLAEVVKYGVILDEQFFRYLETNTDGINSRDAGVLRHIISRSCQLKADVVEKDEYERTGLRAVLNYGHTFAHAFEALSGYGELLHGEAVSIGMICASRLAERQGLIDDESTTRQSSLLTNIGLPTALPVKVNFSVNDIIDRMMLDKKTVGGHLRFVLPTKIGHVDVFKDVETETVANLLTSMLKS